jgi:RNA polymerase sigma-70 factor, ECF subfamily
MAVGQRFEWVPTMRAAGGLGRPEPQRWQKRLAPRLRRRRNVDTKATSQARGEDWEFVQRAIEGDSEAFATLFARERERLYRMAVKVLRNKEDAEDALQNGLCSAFTKLHLYQGRSRFSTWLTRIVLNAALMNRRKIQSAPQLSLDERIVNGPGQWATRLVGRQSNPEQAYARSETRALVMQEMKQLSPILQSAFRLRFIENLSSREAAKAENVNLSAFKSRAMRARRQVMGLLAPKGVVLWRGQFLLKDRSCPTG